MSSELMHLAAAACFQDDHAKKYQLTKEEPRVLLVTTVDVGGGASERIEVRAGEVPEDVARAFCLRHHLPDAIVGPLAAHLEENLRKAAANRVGGDSGKFHDGLASQQSIDNQGGQLDQPQRSKSPRMHSGTGHQQQQLPQQLQTQQSAPGPHGSSAGGASAPGGGGDGVPQGAGGGGNNGASNKPHYSFGSGMDERLYEQLSSKLMDESQAPSTRRGNWVSASEVLSGGGGGSGHNSKRSSTGLSTHPTGPYQYGKSTAVTGPSPRDRDSVHLRLYATAQERAARLEERRRMANAEVEAALTQRRSAMSWISAEMMRGRGANGAYDNYGEMLYAEGVEALMARLKRAEAERKSREARELEGVTFAPVITKKAWELKQRERNSMNALDAAGADEFERWQRLHVRGMRKSTQERLEQLRIQREAAEVAECTFRPRINKNSDVLMMERAEALKVLNLTHHEQLFADAVRRQAKMEELQRWYPDGFTFQPQVNKDPKALEYLRRSWDRLKQQQQQSTSTSTPSGLPTTSGTTTSTQGAGSQMPPVVARLYAEAERKQVKIEAARQALYGPIDPVTQKPFFQPDCGRGPRGGIGHARSARRGQHIGEYLYRTAQELAAKRAAAEDAERRAVEEDAARSHTTAMSQRMFTDLKLKRFRQIFEYLDEEGSGSLDLLAALGRAPPADDPDWAEDAGGGLCRHPRVDNLDSEVLLDVEAAADVWARANGLMLTNEEQQLAAAGDMQLAGGSPSAQGGASGADPSGGGPLSHCHPPQAAGPSGSTATSPSKAAASQQPHASLSFGGPGCGGPLSGPCPPLSIEMFMSCMEEALRLRRGPRAYLVPSPPAKQAPIHSFRPAINARSRALAAKTRPDCASTFDLLHRVAAKTAERLEVLRRKKEEQGLEGCTFQPQLNPNRNSMGGRMLGRSTASRNGSLDPSAFALAAAGIAAASDEVPSPITTTTAAAVEADRRSLQQQLQDLRLAADAAMNIQTHLKRQAAEEGGGIDEGVEEEVERFSVLEKELRDMQALTEVAIDDHDRQLSRHAEARKQQQLQQQQLQQQQQALQLSQSLKAAAAGTAVSGSDSMPPGGLQELAAVLGVVVPTASTAATAASANSRGPS